MGVIDNKLKDIEKRFNELEEMKKKLQEQGAELNRRLSQVVEEQVMLRGANRELTALKDDKSEPKPEIPKPKNEKEKKK